MIFEMLIILRTYLRASRIKPGTNLMVYSIWLTSMWRGRITKANYVYENWKYGAYLYLDGKKLFDRQRVKFGLFVSILDSICLFCSLKVDVLINVELFLTIKETLISMYSSRWGFVFLVMYVGPVFVTHCLLQFK